MNLDEHAEHGDGYCFGPCEPDICNTVPDHERASRVLVDDDICVVDENHRFIRGCLDLPIIGGGVFRWLVWVSLSETNFQRTMDLWDTNGRENEPPYFGWLSSSIAAYPETMNLKTHVHTTPRGERPTVELEPTDHPLSVEQRYGITEARAAHLAGQASSY